MDNKQALYASGVNLRLRQVGLEALAIARATKKDLAVVPDGDGSQISFCIRKAGKPDQTDPAINEILSKAAVKFSAFVKVEGNKLSLVNEKKKAEAPKNEAPKAEPVKAEGETATEKKSTKPNEKEEK